MIRRAETDADLAAYCDVWNAITPREPTTVEDVKRRLERQPERLYLVALEEEEVVGLGFCGPSQSPERTAVVVRVLPEHRRRGIGSELLDRVVAHAAQLERPQISGMVFEDDPESIAWVTNRGLRGIRPPGRAVARAFLGRGRAAGTGRCRADAARREPTRGGVRGLGGVLSGHARVAAHLQRRPTRSGSKRRCAGPITLLALEDGRVVGAAALLERVDGLAEHGLTAVRRSHRGRGIATALKQALIHWAAEHGFRELTTWTQDGNAAMQAVNLKLGYRPRPAVINVWRPV